MESLNYSQLWNVMAVLAAFSIALAQGELEPSFVAKPTDTEAAVGRPVTIYCSVANLGGYQVYWTIDLNAGEAFTLGPFTNRHSSYQRYQIVGDASTGEYNLRISDVRKDDAGRYTCMVHNPFDVAKPAEEFGAKLTVQDNASAPMAGFPKCGRDPEKNSQLTVDSSYIEGDTLTLSCTSKEGVPLAELSWERVQIDGVKFDLPSKTKVTGSLVTTTAVIDISSVDHQSFYKCTETHPSKTIPRSCMTPFTGSESLLYVRFKPQVMLTPKAVSVRVLETVKVTMSCTAYANPGLTMGPTIILPLNKTAEYPNGIDDKTVVEVELTVDDVGKDFYCLARNDQGLVEESVDIRRQSGIPTWLVLVIIGCIAVFILLLFVFCSCLVCVDRSKYHDDRRTPKSSRPTSMQLKEDDVNGDNSMIPIEEFQGGQESATAYAPDDKTDANNDFETGEEVATQRYQNVNEAFEGDGSTPSSSEPILQGHDPIPTELP